jgi:5'-nucleotidase
MTKKCILLIDMDGVTADWYGGFLKIYNQRYPERQTISEKDMDEYYIENKYPEEHKADCLNVVRGEPGFYENLDPIEGAIEALSTLPGLSDFVEPFICSSPDPLSVNHVCESEKTRWIEKHLGQWWKRRVILTNDKTLVRGHFLIDDKAIIRGALEPTWNKLLYTQPHNAHITDQVRFTWADWPTLVESLKAVFEMINADQQESRIVVPTRGLPGSRRG